MKTVVRLVPAGVVIAGVTNDVAQLYPWYDEERMMGNIMSVDEIAKANDMPYIDYYSAMVYGDRELNYALSNDRVHPNADGCRIMEDMIS